MYFETVDKEQIKAGDAIMYQGKLQTVSRSDIKRNNCTGLTIFGDSFQLGQQKIQRAIFPKFYKGERL